MSSVLSAFGEWKFYSCFLVIGIRLLTQFWNYRHLFDLAKLISSVENHQECMTVPVLSTILAMLGFIKLIFPN